MSRLLTAGLLVLPSNNNTTTTTTTTNTPSTTSKVIDNTTSGQVKLAVNRKQEIPNLSDFNMDNLKMLDLFIVIRNIIFIIIIIVKFNHLF